VSTEKEEGYVKHKLLVLSGKVEISMANKSRIPKTINIPKLNITPDQSFLFQGREALDSGNEGAALQLFMMEMENGKEKEKALFEAVRLHESKKTVQ